MYSIPQRKIGLKRKNNEDIQKSDRHYLAEFPHYCIESMNSMASGTPTGTASYA